MLIRCKRFNSGGLGRGQSCLLSLGGIDAAYSDDGDGSRTVVEVGSSTYVLDLPWGEFEALWMDFHGMAGFEERKRLGNGVKRGPGRPRKEEALARDVASEAAASGS